jgi:hypothetical protein
MIPAGSFSECKYFPQRVSWTVYLIFTAGDRDIRPWVAFSERPAPAFGSPSFIVNGEYDLTFPQLAIVA